MAGEVHLNESTLGTARKGPRVLAECLFYALTLVGAFLTHWFTECFQRVVADVR